MKNPFAMMAMMAAAMAAAFREDNDAPAITTSPRSRGGRPRTEEVLELNRKLKRLRAAGHTYEEMQAITGASPGTIMRHLNDQVLTAKR